MLTQETTSGEEETQITVGRLGTFRFPAGWYAYAGSALGPGGIRARLARHRRSEKRLHWHIDYLMAFCSLAESWEVTSSTRLECAWAAAAGQLPGARIAVPGFGASDCRCAGHLICIPVHPSAGQMKTVLQRTSPRKADIQHRRYAISTNR
jgi:Uri superfamily endonuclease